MSQTLRGSPDRTPPLQYDRSFHRLGVLAQRGRRIEVRVNTGVDWERFYLDEQAARLLLDWLPFALDFALDWDPSHDEIRRAVEG